MVENHTYSTADTELAAWLLCSGIELLEVIRNDGYPSVMIFSDPNQLTQQLSIQFYAYEGEVEIARRMFKSYKLLLRRIKGRS